MKDGKVKNLIKGIILISIKATQKKQSNVVRRGTLWRGRGSSRRRLGPPPVRAGRFSRIVLQVNVGTSPLHEVMNGESMMDVFSSGHDPGAAADGRQSLV